MIISKPSEINKQAVGCLLRYRDRYLLVYRTKDNLWGSVAGSVHEGESPQRAIERELKEELGLKIKPKFFKTTFHKYGREKVAYNLFFYEFKKDPQKEIVLNEDLTPVDGSHCKKLSNFLSLKMKILFGIGRKNNEQ